MRVVICGAGIAGLTLANRLVAQGHDVVLLERAQGPRPQGYMIDFFGPGYDAVEAMGLLPAVEQVAYHIDEATLVDERGRRSAGIDPAQFAVGDLLSIMRPDLERVLRKSLPAAVDLRFGRGPVGVEQHSGVVEVALDDGTALTADLLVGADGIHSTVRRLVFGDEDRFVQFLGFHTCAFTFDSPRIHDEVSGRFSLTDTVGRQMGFYGLRDGRVATYAVHRTSDPAVPIDLRAAVRDTYTGLRWVVPEALEACPPPEEIYYDQVAQAVLPTWSKGKVVLIGDARTPSRCWRDKVRRSVLPVLGCWPISWHERNRSVRRSRHTNGCGTRSSRRNNTSLVRRHAGSCRVRGLSCCFGG
jgi:2-polyprenyl-6-methoxyphenol hydroxylase-like FAD-dependent oxidoreductase